MSATVVYYPNEYIGLINNLRARIVAGRPQSWANNINIGISTNFDKICGCVLQVRLAEYSSFCASAAGWLLPHLAQRCLRAPVCCSCTMTTRRGKIVCCTPADRTVLAQDLVDTSQCAPATRCLPSGCCLCVQQLFVSAACLLSLAVLLLPQLHSTAGVLHL